ncbi:MAG TPA: hypothetical protein EYG30_03150 [Planctomycetes bacterium]|jgi:hypothetical protein|nr:hypothetical protein [Planctomycetota bacterium]HIL51240.1 hypothetical protein [Planctomycetota bacterium]
MHHPSAICALALLAGLGQAQDSTLRRLDTLEAENEKLHDQIEALASEVERFEMRDIMPEVGESRFGMGPAASKVYAREQGLSVGGYGEATYTNDSTNSPAKADFVRAVLYFGYKFDERWVYNSEIEFEHASTGENGSASVEFAYLEYHQSDALNARAGLLLAPMGWLNEMHEPTTYYGASRPEIERRILPSTWRENGFGIHGSLSGLDYKLYAMGGLDGAGFSAEGLRGGRQKGSKALAEDIALVGRLDYSATPGLVVGASAYFGDSGQGDASLGDISTTIYDLHGEYQWRGLRLRGLFVQAELDDTEQIFAAKMMVVGAEMQGYYLEAGYDLFSLGSQKSEQQLIPFVRYEHIDTHAQVASSLTADPDQEDDIVTMGLNWLPIQNIVFKASYQDFDRGADRFQLSLGYVF